MTKPCSSCGAKPGRGGVILRHKSGCSLETEKALAPCGVDFGPTTKEQREELRNPHNLPEVGRWFVLGLSTPILYDMVKDRKLLDINVTLAQVLEVKPHAAQHLVTFDMENFKSYTLQFEGDLFTPAERLVESLRALADMVEKAIA